MYWKQFKALKNMLKSVKFTINVATFISWIAFCLPRRVHCNYVAAFFTAYQIITQQLIFESHKIFHRLHITNVHYPQLASYYLRNRKLLQQLTILKCSNGSAAEGSNFIFQTQQNTQISSFHMLYFPGISALNNPSVPVE